MAKAPRAVYGIVIGVAIGLILPLSISLNQADASEFKLDYFLEKGFLTAPNAGKPYGSDPVGKYQIDVRDDLLRIFVNLFTEPSYGKIYEGWLVDVDTGEELSIGKLDERMQKGFFKNFGDAYMYELLVITERPRGITDPSSYTYVGGVPIIIPKGLSSSQQDYSEEMDEATMKDKEIMMKKDLVVSPKKQMEFGVYLHDIQCRTSLELVLKQANWTPACVKSSSVDRMIEMGWAADQDTQHDKMMTSMTNSMEEKMINDIKSMTEFKETMSEAAKTSTSVSEGMGEMGDQSTTLKMGEFVGLAGHQGQGTAKIISTGEKSFLRFEDFTVTNGPDLFVYIAQDGAVHKGILLEKLKGSTGNQNYELPADIDLEVYNTAVVYCKLFGVYFAEASLS